MIWSSAGLYSLASWLEGKRSDLGTTASRWFEKTGNPVKRGRDAQIFQSFEYVKTIAVWKNAQYAKVVNFIHP